MLMLINTYVICTGKGRKAQVKGKRPRVVGNPSTDHSYMTTEEEELDIEEEVSTEEEELDIGEEGHLFWFQKPGVVSAYRPNYDAQVEGEEAPGSPYYMNLSDYESEYGHAHAVETVITWDGPLNGGGGPVVQVPKWAHERVKRLRADADRRPKTRSQTVKFFLPFIILLNQCHRSGLSHDH
ncbi:hypothetical protein HanPSC8_Chr01g0003551 [Helianthus annuus]|nr:hypothetical protein HanPSC8_Chr01g0003551 [Helianthus annuus]